MQLQDEHLINHMGTVLCPRMWSNKSAALGMFDQAQCCRLSVNFFSNSKNQHHQGQHPMPNWFNEIRGCKGLNECILSSQVETKHCVWYRTLLTWVHSTASALGAVNEPPQNAQQKHWKHNGKCVCTGWRHSAFHSVPIVWSPNTTATLTPLFVTFWRAEKWTNQEQGQVFWMCMCLSSPARCKASAMPCIGKCDKSDTSPFLPNTTCFFPQGLEPISQILNAQVHRIVGTH